MRRIFGLVMVLAFSTTAFGNDPITESDVEIYLADVNDELNINVGDKLANTKVTVSVFDSTGVIVIESSLGLGLNKIDTSKLEAGDYVAVVRENEQYKSKQAFEVI